MIGFVFLCEVAEGVVDVDFSKAVSCVQMDGAAFHRPLLQLYWTMTWQQLDYLLIQRLS